MNESVKFALAIFCGGLWVIGCTWLFAYSFPWLWPRMPKPKHRTVLDDITDILKEAEELYKDTPVEVTWELYRDRVEMFVSTRFGDLGTSFDIPYDELSVKRMRAGIDKVISNLICDGIACFYNATPDICESEDIKNAKVQF
jgi:hypothetical protein